MSNTQWTRASQFNWTFDNMGGAPLMEAVAGAFSGYLTSVQPDGKVYVERELPGPGAVYYLRGVWKAEAVFPWNGFWSEPESGDLTNYYAGGSWSNKTGFTEITLGTALPPGTEVQVYYIYLTGLKSSQYDALNTYPCIRQATHARNDYTYDFAVDRILDLMALLHFAGLERGEDYTDAIKFLWQSYYDRAASLGDPLIFDTFERALWDKGSYLLYNNSTQGIHGFKKFAIEPYTAEDNLNTRALRIILPEYSTAKFSAWWGYGLNWHLSNPSFSAIDEVRFKLQSPKVPTQVGSFYENKIGSANLIIKDGYTGNKVWSVYLEIIAGGQLGEAIFKWQLWELGATAFTKETIDVFTKGINSPITLFENLQIWWEPGEGVEFVAGDYWSFNIGLATTYPRKLHITLNDSNPGDPDQWGEGHTYYHTLPDRFEVLTDISLNFSQFWKRENIIDDRNRRRASWGSWYTEGPPFAGGGIMTALDFEDEVSIEGETFYTQLKAAWDLPEDTTALGFWTGLNTAEVDSTGHTNLNFAINPAIAGQSSQSIRIKVKDAHSNYFYTDQNILIGTWSRITVSLGSMIPQTVGATLTHPVQLVDLGINSTPPKDGYFLLTDLKFDDHITFAGASQLRVLEFKYFDTFLALNTPPAWWLDDLSLNLQAVDPYPYVPRLAISMGPYGANAWRGPSLVHYAHPLAPYLVDRFDLKDTFVQFHRDAQNEYNKRYGGTKGPIMPVHTRNDIENIAILGEANFGKFCWWPEYPETTHALGQLWAFYRLAEYYFVSGDTQAWTVLEGWLNWFDAYIVADGSSWQFPIWYGDTGFSYDIDSYCPGSAASIVIGCLYIYMRNGHSSANTWARRLLDDLRVYKQSEEYGGLVYRSDYHYSWMNALVAHAFGLAVTGRKGAAFGFASTPEDRTHFNSMISHFFALSGNTKPNLLNSDLIPFTYIEDVDNWDYAPHYVFMRQMGSTEGLVLMMGAALDYALVNNNWVWFDRLLAFILSLNSFALQAHNIAEINTSFDLHQIKNLVRTYYGRYLQDNTLYTEAKNPAMIDSIGEQPLELDLTYKKKVITESRGFCKLITSRLLEKLSAPREEVKLTTFLEGLRYEIGDVIKINAVFHNYQNAEFTVYGKKIDLNKRRVQLLLSRQVNYSESWAVDATGTAYDSFTIDDNSPSDPNWSVRSYAS